MKKLSFVLALSLSLAASFVFAAEYVCKDGKSFVKQKNGTFVPLAIYSSDSVPVMELPLVKPTPVVGIISEEKLEVDKKDLENCADFKAMEDKQKKHSRKK